GGPRTVGPEYRPGPRRHSLAATAAGDSPSAARGYRCPVPSAEPVANFGNYSPSGVPLRRGFSFWDESPRAGLRRIALLRKNGILPRIGTCALRPRFGGAFPVWQRNPIPAPRVDFGAVGRGSLPRVIQSKD